jgi:hypothetical protein
MRATLSILTILAVLSGGLLLGSAFAADGGPAVTAGGPTSPVVSAEADPLGTVGEIVKAARGGQWRLVAALALGLAMFGLGKVRGRVKWFAGDRGGAVLVLLLALGGGFASALATSAPLDWRLVSGALSIGLTAAGGFNVLKKIAFPKD